uniref:Anoctamin n=1 Tax=Falco tinnunculus TaxID=100819 RepID=A0A8C4TYD9_FALTI
MPCCYHGRLKGPSMKLGWGKGDEKELWGFLFVLKLIPLEYRRGGRSISSYLHFLPMPPDRFPTPESPKYWHHETQKHCREIAEPRRGNCSGRKSTVPCSPLIFLSSAFLTLFCRHRLQLGLSVVATPLPHLTFPSRCYFGEKVALYFAWLGWYTYLLGVAALVGLVVFVAGITVFSSSQVSKEICEANDTIMCPLCDQKCPFWLLSDTCTYAKVTHMIDNEGTVLFAMFMAIWATVFLELWKRHRATVVTDWDLYRWDEDEEELAMELINNLQHEPRRYQHSYFRSTIILLLVLVMIAVLIGIAHALVIYRVIATAFFSQSNSEFLREQANTMAVMTGAVLHYITIVIMNKVNRRVALYLCDLEKPRTFSQRENNFTVKIFTFQFFTNFSSLIYIAFFLGRINGHPGNYMRVAGRWRLEECHPSGCITDLFIQMAIIMLLKQTISNVMEYLRRPKKRSMVLGEEEAAEDPCKSHWLSNYELKEVNIFSLFDEFLEMVIQYSFTTIFVAAFPLAPLLAFCNNIFEIHLDAIKMMRLYRRMVPRKANDIGIWLQVLEAVGILAVIGNGLVIAITSDFIPMQVYKYTYSPCMMENSTGMDCSTGYINHSLSVFRIQDFEAQRLARGKPGLAPTGLCCRYRDYRNTDDYSYTVQFWHIFAARLAFLILFEHVALCVKVIAAWYIPDVPQSVKNKFLDRKHSNLRKQLRWGSACPSSRSPCPSCHPKSS